MSPLRPWRVMSAPKYSKDAPFTDPVVRCDSCIKLVKTASVQKHGCCTHCGNRRVRAINLMTEAELTEVKTWNIDPEWLALFEVVDE